MILEYILIISNFIKQIFKNPPKSWNTGKLGDVILIPGFTEGFVFLETIGNLLNKIGYKIWVVPNLQSTGKIETEAKRIANFIKEKNLTNIIIVAHSRGGLIAKYIVDSFPEIAQKTSRIIAISTPWHGTLLGNLYIKNLAEVKIGSALIVKISGNKINFAKIINLIPNLDNHVLPNKNLVLPGVQTQKISVVGHTRILEAAETLRFIKNLLQS